MIPIKRLEEPEILKAKKAQWDQTYRDRCAKKPDAKPRHNQYAHEEVKCRLQAMSYHKCFYCEQSVKDRCEVDHYIEVAERPDLAHDWKNLYLACFDCNHKKQRNSVIPVAECIDPCDTCIDPSEHLAFKGELVQARSNSTRGLRTIQKYRLDRLLLDSERRKQLNYFLTAWNKILLMMHREMRPMRDDEKELLHRFAQPDSPFSLMFRYYLDEHGF